MATKSKTAAAKKSAPVKTKAVAKKAAPVKKVKPMAPAKKSSAKPAPKAAKPAAKLPAKKMATTRGKIAAKPVAKAAAKPKAKALPKKKVAPVPKGYSTVTPYMIMQDASKAVAYYQKVFGAKLVMKMDRPNGKISHAELKIGDTRIMLADEAPEKGVRAPQAFGGSAVSMHMYMKNVDAVLKDAVSAGAKLLMPAQDMFYGDRIGAIEDPFGHKWHLATRVEDVSNAMLKKRMAELHKK